MSDQYIKEQVREHQTEIKLLKENREDLIKAYDEYIDLLGEELNGAIGIAYVHNWRPVKGGYEKGIQCRENIEKLKNAIR